MSDETITNTAATNLGKKLDKEGWKVINATKCASDKEAWEAAFDEVANGEDHQCILLEKPPLKTTLYPSMLAYYHSKNGGEMKNWSRVWFDQTTNWFKTELKLSGIQYPKEWFYIGDIPNDPEGVYRLGGSFGGSVKLLGTLPYISQFTKDL